MTSLRLAKKKELWVPTFRGWVLIVFSVFVIVAGYMRSVQSFLAVSEPVQAQILAVEEWISPYAIESAASEFKDHGYDLLVVIGNERRLVVPILKEAGVDARLIVKIPVQPALKDRTFALAVALRNWLLTSGLSGKTINVYTQGVHGRRSRLLFRKALGPGFTVGIISCADPYYDPKQWWETSEGFKTVIDETIAFIYTEVVFLPVRVVSGKSSEQ
ncbi:MAG: hypothetical protein ACLP3B_10615 [Syntrophobacteraceae bacterium]